MATAIAGLHPVDLALCAGYLLSVLAVGLFFTLRGRHEREQRRRERELSRYTGSVSDKDECVLEEYYLGGRRLPWWALAVADASSYIDISGTMINSALVYALGVQGMYIELRGGLCLFLAFQMAFTGKLSRRCPIKTRGEWIKFRFGDRREAALLRATVAITSLTSGVLAVTYFAVGGGKFFSEFVTLPAWWGLPSDFWAAALLMGVAMLYTVASGYTTVVYTDVYQSAFIFSSFAIVAAMGVAVNLPDHFSVFLQRDGGESGLVAVNTTRRAWVSAVPSRELSLPNGTAFSMYNSFGVTIGTYLALQAMRAASGPGRLGLQTVLATRSERDVRSQTFLAMVLLAFRWAFSGGIALLAVQYSLEHAGVEVDPERVVPVVIDKMLPAGVKGFVLASLVAAALTTFDSTINSASSYWAVDMYQAFLNPTASQRQLLWQARASTLFVLVSGLLLSLYVTSINGIWGFISIALAGGMMWPFFLCWYWSRFNATGCLVGIFAGFTSAFAIFIFDPLCHELRALMITSSASAVACLAGCLLTRPVSDTVLRRFYRAARPPGLWRDTKLVCFSSDTLRNIDRENRSDLLSTVLIATAQLSLYLLAVSVVAKAWTQVCVLATVLALVTPLVYFKWYLNLPSHAASPQQAEEGATDPFLDP